MLPRFVALPALRSVELLRSPIPLGLSTDAFFFGYPPAKLRLLILAWLLAVAPDLLFEPEAPPPIPLTMLRLVPPPAGIVIAQAPVGGFTSIPGTDFSTGGGGGFTVA